MSYLCWDEILQVVIIQVPIDWYNQLPNRYTVKTDFRPLIRRPEAPAPLTQHRNRAKPWRRRRRLRPSSWPGHRRGRPRWRKTTGTVARRRRSRRRAQPSRPSGDGGDRPWCRAYFGGTPSPSTGVVPCPARRTPTATRARFVAENWASPAANEPKRCPGVGVGETGVYSGANSVTFLFRQAAIFDMLNFPRNCSKLSKQSS